MADESSGAGSAPVEQDDPAAPRPIDARRLELLREAVTMALYISLSLLAVLLATPTPTADRERFSVAMDTFLTGVGLVAAHHVAFRLSSRLVHAGVLTVESRRALSAQAMGGIPVAVVAAVPILLFGVETGLIVSEVLLLLVVFVVGWRAIRQAVNRRRAFLYLLSTGLVAVGVIALKIWVGH